MCHKRLGVGRTGSLLTIDDIACVAHYYRELWVKSEGVIREDGYTMRDTGNLFEWFVVRTQERLKGVVGVRIGPNLVPM